MGMDSPASFSGDDQKTKEDSLKIPKNKRKSPNFDQNPKFDHQFSSPDRFSSLKSSHHRTLSESDKYANLDSGRTKVDPVPKNRASAPPKTETSSPDGKKESPTSNSAHKFRKIRLLTINPSQTSLTDPNQNNSATFGGSSSKEMTIPVLHPSSGITFSALSAATTKAKFFRRPRPQIRNRLVQKNGEYNIRLANVKDQRSRYASDLWTTLVEVKWRWSLLACAFSFLLSWFFFALIYYCIIYAHGDLDEHQEDSTKDWKPCLNDVKSFLAVFMFSLETQHTIGYGSRHPSDHCPQIVFTVALQSIYGVVIQTLLVGIVFAKLTRPKNRAQTLIFSKNAVIAMRDSKLCFMFRIGDMRKNNLANGNLRVVMIRKRVTAEGEILPYYLRDMAVSVAGVDFCPPFSWPPIVFHVIDENSPLYEYSAAQLQAAKFEIMVILEGVNSTTGQNCQARTSYLPSEILWGRRFDRLVTYQRDNGEYRIDYNKFHTTFPVPTLPISAREFDTIKALDPDAPLKQYGMPPKSGIDRHDCNMWETPYSTIHNEEVGEGDKLLRKTTLQTLFNV